MLFQQGLRTVRLNGTGDRLLNPSCRLVAARFCSGTRTALGSLVSTTTLLLMRPTPFLLVGTTAFLLVPGFAYRGSSNKCSQQCNNEKFFHETRSSGKGQKANPENYLRTAACLLTDLEQAFWQSDLA